MRSARRTAWRAFALLTLIGFANGAAVTVKGLPRAARDIYLFNFSLDSLTFGLLLALLGLVSVGGMATALYVLWNPGGDEKKPV